MADNIENKELENKADEKKQEDDKVSLNGKSVSVLANLRQISEREKHEQLEAESRRAEKFADAERAKREKYAQKLAQDKIELMKLKQGVISEDDIEKEEVVEKQYTVFEKVGNFFYHNKMYIIIVTFIVLVAGFLIYDMVTTKRPDVAIMIIAEDDEFYFRTQEIQKHLEPYCKDYNGDGVVFVRASYMPAAPKNSTDAVDLYYEQADQTKLVAEFQSADSIMVIADEYTCEVMQIQDGVLRDMTEVYPDDENATKLGYMLNGTDFAEGIMYSAISDDLFVGFRIPTSGFGVDEEKFNTNFANAMEFWDNYLNGNAVSADAVLHSSRK
ncbi:MAG: hypothetical protein IJF18_06655 [Oscillospiraceae bacterium]|nr:hypothetical protein [Oscillospiraceae bacterium]